jgi:endonuclease/exonuclease/phosphatase family metal-dependent hydrolase
MRSWGTVRVLLGTVVLVDVLRVFLPSLITIFGRAGSTPAELIGAYAGAWFAAAYLTVVAVRWWPADRIVRGAGLALLGGRALLQVTDGGWPQLVVASLALFAGLCWLIATAMSTVDARVTMLGLVAGLAAATALHAALDTIDLAWRGGWAPSLVLAVLLVAFAKVLLTAHTDEPTEAGGPRLWLAVGPAVLLWGLYTGNTAYADAAGGWWAAFAVTVAGPLAIAVAARPARFTLHPLVPALALVASAAGFAFTRWTVAAQVVGALALAGCLGWAATTGYADRPHRRGLWTATGLFLFVVFTFAYYAAYDLALPNDYVPVVAAVLVGGPGIGGMVHKGPVPLRPVLAGTAAAALAFLSAPLWRPATPAWAPPEDGLRVAAYNIRMGFGLSGTLDLDRQADALRALRPHVIALSEVDRAWLLNGGHEDLRRLADRLGLTYLWAPAADEVWGDALLTDLPVSSVRRHPLVRGGPTGAQALEVVLRWRGREVTVVATHLQPPAGWASLAQVEQLADIVRNARQPVVVAGDLNLQPGEPAWDVLMEAGLTDPFAPIRPLNTIPTPGELGQIDHILVTSGFIGRNPANPNVPYSDHRPVAVTLVEN